MRDDADAETMLFRSVAGYRAYPLSVRRLEGRDTF